MFNKKKKLEATEKRMETLKTKEEKEQKIRNLKLKISDIATELAHEKAHSHSEAKRIIKLINDTTWDIQQLNVLRSNLSKAYNRALIKKKNGLIDLKVELNKKIENEKDENEKKVHKAKMQKIDYIINEMKEVTV